MPLTLGHLQREFTRCTGLLIGWAYQNGYALTYGETWRDPRIAALNAKDGKGITNSLHCDRLAVDFNLFKDGKYLLDSKDHKPLGDYWKTLHPLARWGGDFTKPDGNHYSFEWQGRR